MVIPCCRSIVLGAAAALIITASAWAGAPQAPRQTTSAAGSYTGPGSCAASSCHGSVRPVPGSSIQQTEYNTWITQDKHAQATAVLTNPVSVRIAKILGLPRADTAPRCLACHAVDVPAAKRTNSYSAEGVSCEACHGPASGWLGPHTMRGWTHAQSVALGMYDTKDLVKRAELCTTCHVGTADKFVDHEMIAAGHPDLVFDLAAFSAAMPRHWQIPADAPWETVRAWRTGQLVQLQEGLERLARSASKPGWPEYAELDCFSCHHGLTRPEDSWRQARGYADRRAGNPPWNHSRAVIARLVARTLDPAAADRLDTGLAKVSAEVARRPADRQAIATLTTSLTPILEDLSRRAEGAPVDAQMTVSLIRTITGDADRIANEGERSAEQAAMSLETLLDAYTRNVSNAGTSAARTSLDALFEQLQNPSAYDARRFAPALERLGSQVPAATSHAAGPH